MYKNEIFFKKLMNSYLTQISFSYCFCLKKWREREKKKEYIFVVYDLLDRSVQSLRHHMYISFIIQDS